MLKIIELNLQKLKSQQIVDFAYTETLIPKHYSFYEKWLANNLNGSLHYLGNEQASKRQSLKKLLPECESALVFLFSHGQMKKYLDEQKYSKKIAAFVLGYQGLDYHHYIRNSLTAIVQDHFGQSKTLVCVDTMPLLERDLAYQAGLGFIGKNSMLIHPIHGSQVMIGSILLDHKLDLPKKDIVAFGCGDCQNCIKVCPTKALIAPFTVDAGKCISAFTIEQMKRLDPPQGYKTQNYFFGCDACQNVCPFNIEAQKKVEAFKSGEKISLIEEYFLKSERSVIETNLNQLSNHAYKRKFKDSSLERTGRVGMLKNIENLSD